MPLRLPPALKQTFPWITPPFIISAPMRVFSGPALALSVSRAGGLGFLGPGAKTEHVLADLEATQEHLESASIQSDNSGKVDGADVGKGADGVLPVGIGFQVWADDLRIAEEAVRRHRPAVVWLFAPHAEGAEGQKELDEWSFQLRNASPKTQIWVQVASLSDALLSAKSPFNRPDALVIQGSEAGGHSIAEGGMGIMTLFPEVLDAVRKIAPEIPLFAAGGISDGRGVAAALSLGASGVVLGTRFLATPQARISKGYQNAIIAASDGPKATARTTLYNQLRGTNWPKQYAPRGVVNRTWHDHHAGVEFDELKRRHDDLATKGDEGWGVEGRLATYAGAGVGMVESVEDAEVIVGRLRTESSNIVRSLME